MTRPKALLFLATFAASLLLAPVSAEQPAQSAETVEIPIDPLPFVLKGVLRRPQGDGPFPAVVLLPACDRFAGSVDQIWAQALASWGYIALMLDVFTPRGIVGQSTCVHSAPPEIAEDAYRGLDLLTRRRDVDRKRIFLVGFGRGGSLVFAAVERDGIERNAKHKFRAAVGFYPSCRDVKGVMAVPTLVMVGAHDERTLDGCRKMAAGEDDMGISRQPDAGAPIHLVVLPDAYSGFDIPAFQTPVNVLGLHLEYSKAATDEAKEILRQFFQTTAGRVQ